MKNPKHHIIPRYRCEELGIDPDFDENIVEVTREDHALIHWGYKCNDLEPLFEHITPAQWIIDLIPREDNRDAGAAVLNARGEIDDIDMSGENSPAYKHGLKCGDFNQSEYEEYRRQNPETRPAHLRKHKKYHAKNREARNRDSLERYHRKKTETQGEGTLKGFMSDV